MNEYQESVMEQFIEIEPLNNDQFLQLKETLTRIGITAHATEEGGKPILWQSVHVFHRRGRYFLVHFKHMFLLDGQVKSTKITDDDLDRFEAIASLVEKWGLVRCLEELPKPRVRVHVIPHHQKGEWELKAKYKMGRFSKGTNVNE